MTIYIILLVGYCRVYNCKDISMFSWYIYKDYNDKYNYNGRMILRVTLYEYIHNTYLDRIEYSLGS